MRGSLVAAGSSYSVSLSARVAQVGQSGFAATVAEPMGKLIMLYSDGEIEVGKAALEAQGWQVDFETACFVAEACYAPQEYWDVVIGRDGETVHAPHMQRLAVEMNGQALMVHNATATGPGSDSDLRCLDIARSFWQLSIEAVPAGE